MLDRLQADANPSITGLVEGIISDAQRLMRQEVELARREMQDEWTKTKTAAAALGVGMVILALGGLFLCFMLVHLLHGASQLPLWGCYGLVGAAMVTVGAVLLYGSKKKFETFNPLPDESVKELKENVQCLMNPK